MSTNTLDAIVVDTDTLSRSVSGILDLAKSGDFDKNKALNIVAAAIAGPKHNWGYLKGHQGTLYSKSLSDPQALKEQTALSEIMLAGLPTDEEIEMVKKFAYGYITENSHLKPSIRRIYERENLNAEDMFEAIERTDRTWMHQHSLEQHLAIMYLRYYNKTHELKYHNLAAHTVRTATAYLLEEELVRILRNKSVDDDTPKKTVDPKEVTEGLRTQEFVPTRLFSGSDAEKEITNPILNMPDGEAKWIKGKDGKIVDGRESYLTHLAFAYVKVNPQTSFELLSKLVVEQFQATVEPSEKWTTKRISNGVRDRFHHLAERTADSISENLGSQVAKTVSDMNADEFDFFWRKSTQTLKGDHQYYFHGSPSVSLSVGTRPSGRFDQKTGLPLANIMTNGWNPKIKIWANQLSHEWTEILMEITPYDYSLLKSFALGKDVKEGEHAYIGVADDKVRLHKTKGKLRIGISTARDVSGEYKMLWNAITPENLGIGTE